MRILILSLISIFALACAENTAPTTGYVYPDGMNPNGMNPNGMNPNIPPNQNGAPNILQQITDRNVFAPTNGMIDLKVRYLTSNGQSSIPNTRLTFEILNTQNQVVSEINGSSLNTQIVNTNALGEASVTLFAGQPNERPFMVKAYDASAPQVPAVIWNITVGDPNQGAINVSILYASMMPSARRYTYNQFSSAQVTLFREMDCNAVRSLLPTLRGGYLTPPVLMNFTDQNNQQIIPNLDRNLRLSVAAVIYNPQGAPMTFGCAQGIQVMGGQTTEVMVDTFDLPLTYKGTFTSSNRFNLIQTLQQSDDGALSTIGDIFSILRAFGGDDREIGNEIISRFCSLAIACGSSLFITTMIR